MGARGNDFLEVWIYENVPARSGNWIEAMKLADKLRIDTASAGLKLADLDLEDSKLEDFLLGAMGSIDETARPED